MVPWRTIGPALEDYWLNGPFQPRAECFHSLALPRTPKGREGGDQNLSRGKEVGRGWVASRALMCLMRCRCEGVAVRRGGADEAERRDDTAGAGRAIGRMISANRDREDDLSQSG